MNVTPLLESWDHDDHRFGCLAVSFPDPDTEGDGMQMAFLVADDGDGGDLWAVLVERKEDGVWHEDLYLFDGTDLGELLGRLDLFLAEVGAMGFEVPDPYTEDELRRLAMTSRPCP
jgi:hypothetical protein